MTKKKLDSFVIMQSCDQGVSEPLLFEDMTREEAIDAWIEENFAMDDVEEVDLIVMEIPRANYRVTPPAKVKFTVKAI